MPITVEFFIFAATTLVAIVASWFSLKQKFYDKDVRDETRFARLEKALGITEGNGASFIRKGQFDLQWVELKHELEQIELKFDANISNDVINNLESRNDRGLIKERIAAVEVKVCACYDLIHAILLPPAK